MVTCSLSTSYLGIQQLSNFVIHVTHCAALVTPSTVVHATLVLHGLVGLSVALCHGPLDNITSTARGSRLRVAFL